jgi:GT2 family glycosyltransferase
MTHTQLGTRSAVLKASSKERPPLHSVIVVHRDGRFVSKQPPGSVGTSAQVDVLAEVQLLIETAQLQQPVPAGQDGSRWHEAPVPSRSNQASHRPLIEGALHPLVPLDQTPSSPLAAEDARRHKQDPWIDEAAQQGRHPARFGTDVGIRENNQGCLCRRDALVACMRWALRAQVCQHLGPSGPGNRSGAVSAAVVDHDDFGDAGQRREHRRKASGIVIHRHDRRDVGQCPGRGGEARSCKTGAQEQPGCFGMAGGTATLCELAQRVRVHLHQHSRGPPDDAAARQDRPRHIKDQVVREGHSRRVTDGVPPTLCAVQPVSVVIPVHNGAAQLPALLAALTDQVGIGAVEVIVVDNASTDGTAAVARSFPVVSDVLHEPHPGSYVARNTGWRASTADLVAFTDADCIPDPGWLVGLVAALEAGADLAGGPIRPLPSASSGWRSWWAGYDRTMYLDQQENIERDGFAATANLAVRRAVLEEVGGFDDGLKSGGDHAFTKAAVAAGRRLVWAPDAAVGHPSREGLRETWALWSRLGRGYADLAARDQWPTLLRRDPVLRRGFAEVQARAARRGVQTNRHGLRLAHTVARAGVLTGRLRGR